MSPQKLVQLEDYKQFVGARAIDQIRKKAQSLQHLHVAHLNSTYYGGGVAELLTSLTLLMNSLGIKTDWRIIHGPPDFFSITKKMHNALQGGKINLSNRKITIYEAVIHENAVRNHLEDHNMVIIHDPQPLPLILVLLGDIATDDPEGPEVYESLLDNREERIIILSQQDTALVNALQRTAAVVLQKSLREGFGLTVTEAMWKGAAVVGGNVGGICHQIQDGVNGFLVSSVREAAERIVQLVKDKKLRFQLGQKAKETVKKRFLLTRYAEQYLDLFNSFEVVYRLKKMV